MKSLSSEAIKQIFENIGYCLYAVSTLIWSLNMDLLQYKIITKKKVQLISYFLIDRQHYI